MILAGVLLKVGTYGFARFNLPMLPDASAVLMPWLLWISLAGILYGALVALAQSDIKRLVAYSSVSHLGFCMLGLFALDRLSVQGGVLQMVSHGLATGGLFAVVGMIYERFHTREIGDFGDLARRMPVLAFFALVLTLSSIALPFTAGFAGEFPLLLGVFQRGWAAPVARPCDPTADDRRVEPRRRNPRGVVHALDVPARLLRLALAPPTRRQSSMTEPVSDLSLREVLCLAPLVAMIFWIGLQPRFFLDRMGPTLDDLMKPAMQAVEQQREERTRIASVAKPQAACEDHHDNQQSTISNQQSPSHPMTTATLYLLLPETVLIAAAVAIYLGGAFSTARHVWRWIAGGAILAAADCLGIANMPLPTPRARSISTFLSSLDGPGLARCLLLLARRPIGGAEILSALMLGSRTGISAPPVSPTAEYVGSLLLTVAGLMLVSVAGDLVCCSSRWN